LHHCVNSGLRCSHTGVSVVGQQIIDALENGVSKYPVLEGRFPQVSGISFGFDPTELPGRRIDVRRVKVQGSYIELDKVFSSFSISFTYCLLFLRCFRCSCVQIMYTEITMSFFWQN